ncbi:MAG: hypothetical protein PHS41_03350 [Victivallaceae bacterium]|nr:hypothetical protein [Victivallaceae bacterium]
MEKKMSRLWFSLALLSCSATLFGATAPEPSATEIRTIRLRQDDAQVRFASKVYSLKYVSSEEILPFVNSAILRYSASSTIRRVTSTDPDATGALLVSTGIEMLPHVDAIVAALDRPGRVKEKSASAIEGTGLARIAYTPQYRAAQEFSQIIDSTLGSSVGAAYVNAETNTIFWRDQSSAARKTLGWIEKLDRPLPQVNLRLNYYEIRDSDLRDWGFDYLAWKNGPGVNLLNVGYNAGHMVVDELISTVQYAATASWGMGGFFTAPQFDMSFIRCLEQSGNATIAANATLTMINTPVRTKEEYAQLLRYQIQHPDNAPFLYRISLYPEYQNIAKNVLGRTFVGKSYYEDEWGEKHADPPPLNARIINPFVCLRADSHTEDADGFLPPTRDDKEKLSGGGVIFNYSLNFKNVVERGNTGAELSNSAIFAGAATLAFGEEKLLALYEKENDVEQTIGLPILCRIPVIKYLFSTVTSIKERTYIVVTAEATPIHAGTAILGSDSLTTEVKRRIESPFRKSQEEEK